MIDPVPNSTRIGDVEVSANEPIRFSPGEFQPGMNQTEDRVTALALGVSGDSEKIEHLLDYAKCDEQSVRTSAVAEEGDAIIIHCTNCETETRQPITE